MKNLYRKELPEKVRRIVSVTVDVNLFVWYTCGEYNKLEQYGFDILQSG